MDNIWVDLTSKNCVFNCLESQGSFWDHRFGKRKIPEEHVDFSVLKQYLISENPEQIILDSVFGDPFEYSHIKQLLEFCDYQDIKIVFVCNGESKNIHLIKDYDTYCIFNLYGYTNTYEKIIPEGNFSKVYDNLQYCNKINYFFYKQNLIDVEHVEKNVFGIPVDYQPGPLVDRSTRLNHIFDSKGEWFYDVSLSDYLRQPDVSNYKTLRTHNRQDNFVKTVAGYHLLKKYIKPINGRGILDFSVMPKYPTVTAFNKFSLPEDQTSITYKGHILKNLPVRNLVTNTYIPDWDYDLLLSQDGNMQQFVLSEFVNNEKVSI